MCKSVFRRILLFVAIMTSLMAVCLTISFADSQDEASKSEPVQVTQSDSKQNDPEALRHLISLKLSGLELGIDMLHRELLQMNSKRNLELISSGV